MARHRPPPRSKSAPRPRHAAVALRSSSLLWISIALLLFTVVLVRTAWVAEDAYITYRVIDNFLHGHGLTWNTAERVQAYTHPTWLFLNAAFQALTREVYSTGIVLSIAVSLAALALFAFRLARSLPAALLGLVVLLLSRAFVDYATCGLENPLLHLLLAGFLMVWFRTPHDARRFLQLCMIAAFGFLTRADSVLLFAPALVFAAVRLPRRQLLRAGMVALLPVLAWELFSLVYYGSLVPNTAYAKLNTGIQRPELIRQGLYYLVESFRYDPLTLVVTACGVAAPFVAVRKDQIPIVAGMVAYLFYVIWIGGDFMSGRFLTPPLFAAVVLLSQFRYEKRLVFAPVAAAVVLLGCTFASPTVMSGRRYGLEKRALYHGIADERGFFFQQTGLLRADGRHGVDDHPKAVEGLAARGQAWSAQLGGMVGILGYYSGPQAHILDGYALSDPLLARLPERGIKWRVGHFVREVPIGYMLSLLHRNNMIEDKRLAEFYDAVRVVTRDPVFERRRAGVIWKMNTGGYDALLEPFFEARHLQEEAVRDLAAGRTDACIAAATRASELDPRRAAAWSLISQASLQSGDLERARTSAIEAATILPMIHAPDVIAVAAAYEERGDSASAVSIYEELLTIDPKHAVAQERLSRFRAGAADEAP